MVRYVARYADPELYELVSHLRSELSEQNKEMHALQVKNKMLKDEIERLQAEVDLMRRMDEPTYLAFAERDAEIKQLRTELNRTRDAVDSISDERDIFSRTLNKRDYEVEYLKKLLLESKPFVEFNGVELRELLNTELAKQPGAIEQINRRILDIDLLIKKIENATYEQN